MKQCLELILHLPITITKMDNSGYGYITITSLKQLMQLTKEIGREIILSPSNDGIEIYDDYRE